MVCVAPGQLTRPTVAKVAAEQQRPAVARDVEVARALEHLGEPARHASVYFVWPPDWIASSTSWPHVRATGQRVHAKTKRQPFV
jgi:hypothetical protein